MMRREILDWLKTNDKDRLEQLWQEADSLRRKNVGDEVHLRGLIEFSNCCSRSCAYCGISALHSGLQRYRMTADEILACAAEAVEFGYGTVVLQSGEDRTMDDHWLADIVRRIKQTTPLAVTLSVGEWPLEELALWREAGADRYLLRFETSNPDLFRRIHPPIGGETSDRIALLRELRKKGYEIGSGVMVGIPGQTFESLADDIELFATLDLDMIGVGPYIPYPDTPLAGFEKAATGQVPNDELTTYKVIALARCVCPRANIPSTTALATLNLAEGRELGLMRGANIVMPNITPPQYRSLYEIYPAKACLRETARQCNSCMSRRIESIGRKTGRGRGDSQRKIATVKDEVF